mmetsp:Transcript_30151/g.53503  ORF Transcript_30151/g.53503 Transcript_30151/m.53503 type:complete len:138 (+) Transcript_30151:2-415(+)
MSSSTSRCESFLSQLEGKPEKTAALPTKAPEDKVPDPLPALPMLPKREPKAAKDLTELHGAELIMAQVTNIVQELGVDDIELDMGLMQAGLTSRAAVQLRAEMEQAFGDIRIPGTLAFDYPSIRLLSDWLLQQTAAG